MNKAAPVSRYNCGMLCAVVCAGLLGSQLAVYAHGESVFYTLAVCIGALYLITYPKEAVWVGFILLAITGQLYPVEHDELGSTVQGAFRPYIAVVIELVCAMLVGMFLRTRRASVERLPQGGKSRLRLAIFAGVMFLSLAFGYFASASLPSLVDVLRECSGWMTFLVFVFLGYWLASTAPELQQGFMQLKAAVLIFSFFFVAKFCYLSISLGADETAAGFGYSQRDSIFFSGLVLVLLIAQGLTSDTPKASKHVWLAGSILFLATVLSGSRSAVASVVIAFLLLCVIWHTKVRISRRLLAIGSVSVVLIAFGFKLLTRQESDGGVISYVVTRYLMTSSDDASLLARASEMEAVVEAFHSNPMLGRGPFASYSFFDPIAGWKDTTFVDSGVGYLLMKFGLLGMAAFLWFSAGWVRMVMRLPEPLLPVAALFIGSFFFYLAFLPFGPSFFAFQFSWFIGLSTGQMFYLYSTRSNSLPGSDSRIAC